ncbi:hypothetical protein QBC46DRAFT_268500 [Diplogelasinospora grovesii]|uniref:Rhodopsin domain-containing protein n=1 Tax=Diplogelasinospora grovesii TaxID=303347 RepID=A0AAN6N0N3_9PEZI|nr:hypothetical protein QBC46DRAFT_268500 [Diplogelasinospora grovesii]
MRLPPESVVATWPAPNFIDPEHRGPALMVVDFTILPLALIFLGLRLYVRACVLRSMGIDDWLMIAAAVCGIGVTVCVVLAVQRYGWNIHVWDLTKQQLMDGRKVSIAVQTMFIFATGLAKLSILFSYLRIALLDSWFRRLTWASICLVVAATFAFFVVLWTQCNPISSYWQLLADHRHCESEGPPLISQSIATVVIDFIVWALPLWTLYHVRLPTSQRVALLLLFGIGGCVVIAACMRTYWVHRVVDETYDVTWNGFELWIWTAVEVHLGVICGCVPILKALFRGACTRSPSPQDWVGLGNIGRSGERLTKNTSDIDELESNMPRSVGSNSPL